MREAFLDVFSEAWRELKRSRLRTYLALLGVIVGAMGFALLICSLHLENCLRGTQDTNFLHIDVPTMGNYDGTVFRRRPRLKRYEFLPSDGEAIARTCPAVELVAIQGNLNADFRGKQWYQAGLGGTNITRLKYLLFYGEGPNGVELDWGRIFTAADMEVKARVVVIDETMSGKLWGREYGATGRGRIGGKYIHINGVKFEVIGVIRLKRGHGGGVAFIPYTTMRDLFWNSSWQLSAVAKRGQRREAAKQVEKVLVGRIGDPGYSYVTLPGMSYEELRVYTFFGIVGILILFSAGIGVSNKAYIDALERVPQFAVRRALGATTQRIYAIVLMESAIICGFGCFYGGLIGWMIFAAFSAWKWIEESIWYALPLLPLGAMFVFVIGIGIIGSLQGADVAAKANPAEVLARKDIV